MGQKVGRNFLEEVENFTVVGRVSLSTFAPPPHFKETDDQKYSTKHDRKFFKDFLGISGAGGG